MLPTVLAVLGLSLSVAPPGETPSIEIMQQVARRGLPYLTEGGTAWMREQKCVSCHHVPFMIWGLEDAPGRGFALEGSRVGEWRSWAVEQLLNLAEAPRDNDTLEGNADTLAQLILARGYGSSTEDPYPRLEELLYSIQQPEGSWIAGGRLPQQDRPARETAEVTTLWVLAALGTMQDGPVPEARYLEARRRALAWVDRGAEPRGTEWLAVRLLVESDRGSTGGQARLQQALLERQNADGGWSWRAKGPSSALGTGQVLYVLGRIGYPWNSPEVGRAWLYLSRTQRPDGSWAVPSTLAARKGRAVEASSYWGSAWAIVGLLNTLPK